MTKLNHKNIDENAPWIFIPMNQDDFYCIYAWIKKFEANESEDKLLAEQCESIIKSKMEYFGLVYDCEKYGEVKMENLCIYHGSDGFLIPEACFINPGSELKRVQNPLKLSN